MRKKGSTSPRGKRANGGSKLNVSSSGHLPAVPTTSSAVAPPPTSAEALALSAAAGNSFPRRRCISTVVPPHLSFSGHQQYDHSMSQQPLAYSNFQPPPLPNAHQHQFHSAYYQQHQQHEQPFIDLSRFSPPKLDTPPGDSAAYTGQTDRHFTFDNHSWNKPSLPMRKSSLAPNFFSSYRPTHPHTMQQHHHGSATQEYFSPTRMLQTVSQQPERQSQEVPQWRPFGSADGGGGRQPHTGTQTQGKMLVDEYALQNRQQQQQQQQPRQHQQPIGINVELSSDQNKLGTALFDSPLQQFAPSSLLKPESMEFSPLLIDDSNRKKSTNTGQATIDRERDGPKKHVNVPTRKASLMAQRSQLRTPRLCESTGQSAGFFRFTPAPILTPMRNGPGLFWKIANIANNSQATVSQCDDDQQGDDIEMTDESPGLKAEEATATTSGDRERSSSAQMHDSRGPTRKNGFFYVSSQINQPNFAEELEALRKESWASTSSAKSLEETARKRSITESAERVRKESCMSESYYDLPDGMTPQMSDSVPHINIGRDYQARVRKWNEREVPQSELDSIPDRDECLFSPEILKDIDPEQIDAFERLACSEAFPKPGRNKELALHLLMENKGNIGAAVVDLLRCDTLDWEHYQSVFGSAYSDSTPWTPDEVYAFQDAIYKSEKDFHQVAQELTSKTISECVEFYYFWKKVCPDDYRKLRNLRRKRQLLELNLQQMEESIPMKKCSLEENAESDAESDSTFAATDDMRDNFMHNPIPSPSCSTQISSQINVYQNMSPSPSDVVVGMQRNYQPSLPRSQQILAKQKGAQPSADGFFHCRLCDKCFEKVKSLNAHMKSHAMKARAEAEAKAQVDAAVAGGVGQAHPHQPSAVTVANSLAAMQHLGGLTASPIGVASHHLASSNAHLGLSLSTQLGLTVSQHLQQQQQASPNIANAHSLQPAIDLQTALLNPSALGALPHPRPQHPLLSSNHHHLHSIH